jgi:hypothetical protein
LQFHDLWLEIPLHKQEKGEDVFVDTQPSLITVENKLQPISLPLLPRDVNGDGGNQGRQQCLQNLKRERNVRVIRHDPKW